jgi:hypothetical protein
MYSALQEFSDKELRLHLGLFKTTLSIVKKHAVSLKPNYDAVNYIRTGMKRRSVKKDLAEARLLFRGNHTTFSQVSCMIYFLERGAQMLHDHDSTVLDSQRLLQINMIIENATENLCRRTPCLRNCRSLYWQWQVVCQGLEHLGWSFNNGNGDVEHPDWSPISRSYFNYWKDKQVYF